MKKKLFCMMLAVSLMLPTMPVMASEVQELPANVVEVQEETEELVEITELEETPEIVEEEQEVVEEPVIEEEQEVVEEPVIEEEQEAEEEPVIEEEQEVEEEPVIEEEQEVEEEPAIEEAQEAEETPVVEEEPEAEVTDEEVAIEVIEEPVVEDEVLGLSFEEGKAAAINVAIDTWVDGNISVSKEDDYYKFTTVDYLSKGTSYYTFTIENKNVSGGGNSYAYIEIFDSYGNAVDDDIYAKPGNTNSLNLKLESNTEYYIVIDAYQGCTGDYRFQYTVTEDEADTMSEAKEVAANTSYTGNICISREDDYYKFTTVDYTSYYTFSIENKNVSGGAKPYVCIEIRDKNDNAVDDYISAEPGNTNSLKLKLDGNTEYYIVVDAYVDNIGDYSIKYTVTADEPDTMEEAVVITADTVYEGNICVCKEDDWYKFKSVDYTSYYTFSLTNKNMSGGAYERTYLTIYDKSGEEIAQIDGIKPGNTESICLKTDKNKEYYVLLEGSDASTGDYSFEYTVTMDEPDVKEDARVNVAERIQNKATICTSDDVDWYKLTTKNVDLEYEFSITNIDVSGVKLALYDASGAKIEETATASAESKKSFTEELKKNTTYYIKIYRSYSYGAENGSYNFTVSPITEWPFIDVAVKPENWKYEAVKYVYENGIMTGTKSNEFAPDEPLDRAMFATMLYRMAGQPTVTYTNKYPDVPEGKWYSNAVMWASEKGIVNGYSDGRFGTKDYITREQIAKMLMEYGRVQGYYVGQRADFSTFADAGKVSGWANDYMKWAVGSGMIGGSLKDGKYYLNPKGNATRAESATMLKRFMEKYQ